MEGNHTKEVRKVVKDIFATQAFQTAMQEICASAKTLEEAQSNPREVFSRFGVKLSKGDDLQIITENIESDAQTEKPSVKQSRQKVICVSWCTKLNCYIYCAVLQH